MTNIKTINRVSPVLPCTLIIDASVSMRRHMDDGRSRFQHALEALRTEVEQMRKSAMLFDTVELCVLKCCGQEPETVLPPTMLCDVDVDDLLRRVGSVRGSTPLGQSVLEALRLTDQRKAELAAAGAPYLQPLISVITDGEPTDTQDVMNKVYAEVNQRQEAKKLCLIACGIGADSPHMMSVLQQLCAKGEPPLHVQTANEFLEHVRLLNKTVKTLRVARPQYTVTPISDFPVAAASGL